RTPTRQSVAATIVASPCPGREKRLTGALRGALCPVMRVRERAVERAAMRLAKLAALKPWQLMLALIFLGVATALAVYVLVWVVWPTRPLLAAAAGMGVVTWILYPLHRHRRSRELAGEEWIGS